MIESLYNQGYDSMCFANENTPISILEKTIHDEDHWKRGQVLRNPLVQLEELKKLLGIGSGILIEKPIRKAASFQPPQSYFNRLASLESLLKKVADPNKKPLSTDISVGFPAIFVPQLQDRCDKDCNVLGVIGGHYYRKNGKNTRKAPLIQLDLDALSLSSKIDYGEGILEVKADGWSGYYDEVKCSVIPKDKIEINKDKSCAAIDDGWEESYFAQEFGLTPPIFITEIKSAGPNLRINLSAEVDLDLDLSILEIEEIERFYYLNLCEEQIKLYGEPKIDSDKIKEIFEIQEMLTFSAVFGASYGHSFAHCMTETHFKEKWYPLLTIPGALGDPFECNLSIFCCRSRKGKFKYRAYMCGYY